MSPEKGATLSQENIRNIYLLRFFALLYKVNKRNRKNNIEQTYITN